MQLRMNGVEVGEKPKFLTSSPGDGDHAITIADLGLEEPVIVPLSSHGVTSHFPTRKPTQTECDDPSLLHLELTYEEPEWDPHTSEYQDAEARMLDEDGMVREIDHRTTRRLASARMDVDIEPEPCACACLLYTSPSPRDA